MIREEYIKRAKAEICKPYEKQHHYDGIESWIKKRWQKKSSNIASHMQVNGKKMGQKMMNEKAQH